MKETGIIMSGDHPKLILDGLKTQTRRTWGLEEINNNPDNWIWLEGSSMVNRGRFTFHNDKEDSILVIKYPYGQVGDKLWVKETWYQDISGGLVCYKADYPLGDKDWPPRNTAGKIMPSIFMPRWASRITLEITEVRVERLQEISDIDIKLEGVTGWKYAPNLRAEFMKLWDSLNAKRGYGWEKNPWVWAINFKIALQSERK